MPVTTKRTATMTPEPRRRRPSRSSHCKPDLTAAIFVLIALLTMFGIFGLALKYPGEGPPADYDPTTDVLNPAHPLSPLNPLSPFSPFNPINSPGMP